jgi:hypothetical protein
MRLKRLRRRLRRAIARRNRRFARYEATGNKRHSLAALKAERQVIELRNEIKRAMRLSVSRRGLRFIGHFEGFFAQPYNDPVGYATVGYGHLIGLRPV